jgi:FAD/FMN-containing dehydrogenase
MGIVTWASIACRPLPKLKKAYFVPSENLNALVDLTYKLLWKKLGQDCLILNKKQLMALLGERRPVITDQDLPSWVLVFTLEGFGLLPEERVAYQDADLFSTAQSFGLSPKTVIGGVEAMQVADILSQPDEEPYWKLGVKGGCHEIFFLTNLERTLEFITSFADSASSNQYASTDIGVYIQPTVQGVSCHCEFSLYYNPDNNNEKETIKKIDASIPRKLAANGAFFSRPYGNWATFAYGQTSQTIILQREVKEMFDPKGIMNPGKLCF